MKRTIALTAATAVVAGSGFALATPAFADGPEKQAHGTIGGARYEISAEKDDGRYEVDADLDGVPGSTWKLVVRHDGKVIAKRPPGPCATTAATTPASAPCAARTAPARTPSR
jgi:hypothetical protein